MILPFGTVLHKISAVMTGPPEVPWAKMQRWPWVLIFFIRIRMSFRSTPTLGLSRTVSGPMQSKTGGCLWGIAFPDTPFHLHKGKGCRAQLEHQSARSLEGTLQGPEKYTTIHQKTELGHLLASKSPRGFMRCSGLRYGWTPYGVFPNICHLLIHQ